MKRFIIGYMALALASCKAPVQDDSLPSEPVAEAIPADEMAKMKAEVAAAESRVARAEAKERALKASLAEPDPEGSEEERAAVTSEGRDGDMCWADYCPCDKSDPDYGYLDVSLCRNLKMGVAVDDKMMSVGAMSRDARRALREHKEQYGGDF